MGERRDDIVTIVGGTGFLGRRIVECLLARRFRVRVASRRPERIHELLHACSPHVQTFSVDILEPSTLEPAVAGSRAVINAVSLYAEKDGITFARVHERAAADLARAARAAGAARFVQVSGIGADPASGSDYIRARGRGEIAVRDAFPGALVIRPAVMVGPGDAFLTTIMRLMRSLPVIPLFGDGSVRLQPVSVMNAAEGIAIALTREHSAAEAPMEFGGPGVFTYEDLLRRVARQLDVRVILAPLPYTVWSGVAALGRLLPDPPLSSYQVDLMRQDNVANPARSGLGDLGVAGTPIEDVVRLMQEEEPSR